MSESAQIILVQSFLEFCKNQTDKIEIPEDIVILLESLQEEFDNLGQSPEKSSIGQKLSMLKRLIITPIFGFNSQKYDLKILINKLVMCLADMFNVKEMKVLKRGTHVFSLDAPGFQFRAILNYHSPISLDGYLKSWTVGEEKWPYPYQLFTDVEQIRNQLEFPAYEDFKSDMKNISIDRVVYIHV